MFQSKGLINLITLDEGVGSDNSIDKDGSEEISNH